MHTYDLRNARHRRVLAIKLSAMRVIPSCVDADDAVDVQMAARIMRVSEEAARVHAKRLGFRVAPIGDNLRHAEAHCGVRPLDWPGYDHLRR